ncbi:unnamed protein product [Ostreobium quekettii]|uniref:DUF1995 domain-containing protein n=1 Tax=Ostreobium quekettii TaxID=121088 RepID=A0A8S1J0A3_9CHLO|nr:unnamed protein product [Ostreobium quekettii]
MAESAAGSRPPPRAAASPLQRPACPGGSCRGRIPGREHRWKRWAASGPATRSRLPAPAPCSAPIDGGEEAGARLESAKPLPRSPEETVQQALQASRSAFQDGVGRQLVEMPLPLIGATDLDDWPGGIRQQLQAAAPMAEGILNGLRRVGGLEGRLDAEILDDADCVAAWTGQNLAAVLFPTADILIELKRRFEGKKLVLMINPEWRGGQVISDFGLFGRKEKEDFVASFTQSYCLRQYRIQGKDVRLLRCYPGDWQVCVGSGAGSANCVAVETEQPSYKRIEEIVVKDDAGQSGSLLDKIKKEFDFNAQSLKGPEG